LTVHLGGMISHRDAKNGARRCHECDSIAYLTNTGGSSCMAKFARQLCEDVFHYESNTRGPLSSLPVVAEQQFYASWRGNCL